MADELAVRDLHEAIYLATDGGFVAEIVDRRLVPIPYCSFDFSDDRLSKPQFVLTPMGTDTPRIYVDSNRMVWTDVAGFPPPPDFERTIQALVYAGHYQKEGYVGVGYPWSFFKWSVLEPGAA